MKIQSGIVAAVAIGVLIVIVVKNVIRKVAPASISEFVQ